MSASEVRIPIQKIELPGELRVPEKALGLVLFAHGSGSSRFSPRNQFVARTLERAGVGTLLFDLLTEREELEEAATGSLRFNIRFLARRLLDVTRWAQDRASSEDLNLGYFGSSTGAAAALVAAANLGEAISAVVSRGGRPDLALEALERVKAPTLLIVGAADREVLGLNEEAYDRLGCEKALRLVPNATHLFEESGALETVASMSAEWFAHHLQPMVRRS